MIRLTSRFMLLAVATSLLATFNSLAAQTNRSAPRNRSQVATTRQVTPQQPVVQSGAPFQLNPQQIDHLDRVLKWWEYKSGQVKTYQCGFWRWEYDPVFGPKNPKHAKTISRGVIKYAAPDKGMFRVESIGHFTPQPAGKEPSYPQKQVDHAEHWVCDGKSIFEFDEKKKQLIETQLPPELQGKSITDGPLPFLFGAKADKLKQRYWIREQRPPDGTMEYWLEAFPKGRRDATNFQKVEVILDRDFMPTALRLYPPNYDSRRNPARTAYKFDNRKVNNPVHQVQGFMNSFVRPQRPLGWTKHTEVYDQPAPDTPRVAPARGRGVQAQAPPENRRR